MTNDPQAAFLITALFAGEACAMADVKQA